MILGIFHRTIQVFNYPNLRIHTFKSTWIKIISTVLSIEIALFSDCTMINKRISCMQTCSDLIFPSPLFQHEPEIIKNQNLCIEIQQLCLRKSYIEDLKPFSVIWKITGLCNTLPKCFRLEAPCLTWNQNWQFICVSNPI